MTGLRDQARMDGKDTKIETSPLMGLREIQQRLQLSRQRIHQLTEHAGFPPPRQKLAMGRVWLECDVEDWIKEHRPDRARLNSENEGP